MPWSRSMMIAHTKLLMQVLLVALVSLCVVLTAFESKSDSLRKDLKAVETLVPLKDGNHVFFWRPQKVGSSTMLSILMSYGYRYNFLPRRKSGNNAYCRKFAKCAIVNKLYGKNVTYAALEKYVKQRTPGSPDSTAGVKRKELDGEKLANSIPYRISLSHEMCNLNSALIAATLPCSFLPQPESTPTKLPIIKELFMLREPVSRAISVYYFWGELFKMKHAALRQSRGNRAQDRGQLRKGQEQGKEHQREHEKDNENERRLGELVQLGQSLAIPPVVVGGGQHFQYHGDETTAPPPTIAMRYANHTVFKRGMPGPSFTWSAFADNVEDAVQAVNSDRICTVVLERLHESLVVASHVLGWSLADMVVTKHRKALSSHPKAEQWPPEAVDMLTRQLNAPNIGEYRLYNASVAKLDQRLQVLKMIGVDVSGEIETLKALQRRATEICLDDSYLEKYRDMIRSAGLPPHTSQNKLRDVEQRYVDNGHMFSFNREILMSFDVCGPCEAHAMLLSIKLKLADSVENALPLAKLDSKHTKDNVNFAKCPVV